MFQIICFKIGRVIKKLDKCVKSEIILPKSETLVSLLKLLKLVVIKNNIKIYITILYLTISLLYLKEKNGMKFILV